MKLNGEWWLGAAVVSGGVGVALAFGAGAASAETGDADPGKSSSSSASERSSTPRTSAPKREAEQSRGDDDTERSAAVAPRRSAERTVLVKVAASSQDERPARASYSARAERRLARAPQVDETAAPAAEEPASSAPVAAPSLPVAVAAPTVTVGNSDLRLAPGVDVDADWYFPDAGTEPRGIVYLNHGNFRTNNNMEALANSLARDTNSIVVAPTVSTNAFNPYRITAPRTYDAVAGLFGTDRAALTASAAAAGYTGASLPTDFVLAGHSFGGNLVTAVGGKLGANASLKGVLLLDAANNGSDMATGLAGLSAAVPVYQIAAAPRLINGFGSTTSLLIRSRPEEFVGVRIVGGSHVDAEGASSDLLGGLTGGFTKARDAAALQNIAAGWVIDMFDGSGIGKGAGLYPSVGQSVSVGGATVVGLG